ncbi:MAG: hypothetical protein M1818_005947 [Claussenomyces sp. TS43310]|nr:MAG: hypothetical protein M1818_005947 [Claussenomyces sp. TS43310]
MAPVAAVPSLSTSTTLTSTIKPFKPLLRRATLSGTVRSRDEAGLDIDDTSMSTPPSPSKRARTVTFDPLVQEQIFSSSLDFEKDMHTVRSEVRQAIEDHIKGRSHDAYDDLKEEFVKTARPHGREAIDRDSEQDLKAHLLALTSCVTLLGKDCSGLVAAVMRCEWLGRDDGFVKAYVQFLGNLASAQGSYVGLVLNMLVDKFGGIRISSGRLASCPLVSRDQLLTRVHVALKYLLRLIPSASGTLAPILASKFPYSDESKKVHLSYIENLTRLIEYAPELKGEMYALMTERLVKIDLQMQTDLDDDEVSAAIIQAISLQPGQTQNVDEDDDDDDDSDSDAGSVTSDDFDFGSKRFKQVQSNVEKMDAMLNTLFSIYEPYFADPDGTLARTLFNTLLAHFRNIILPSYRSRHTQFLLFHFAQKSDGLIDLFAGECVALAFMPSRPSVLRHSAAAYLASFISRGAHVLPHHVRHVFTFVGVNLDRIRLENETTCRGPDLQRYGTFYASTQALLYIFCFRWRDLIVLEDDEPVEDDDDLLSKDLVWNEGIKELLLRTIYSKLNPLKVCAPSIVEEFARIAHHLKFMYIYPLIETNKRVRLSQYTLTSGILRDSGLGIGTKVDDESWHQLDAYFPFDPYQLPASKKWIEGDYVAWKGIPGLNRDDEDEDSISSEAEEDADLEDEDTATDEDEDK